MVDEWSYFLAVTILTSVSLVTRISGAFLMTWITLTPKVERFLEGLAVSVIAALVASVLVTAETRAIAATLAAVAVVAMSRGVIWAMLSGMIVAAAYPQLLPT